MDWDSVKNTLKVRYYEDFYTKIYYFDTLILVQSSYMLRNITLVNGKRILQPGEDSGYHPAFYSFVYSAGSRKGFYCDSTNLKSYRMVDRDSMLSKEWVLSGKQGNLFAENICVRLSGDTSLDGDILETYRFQNKADTTMTGYLKFVFSAEKLKDVEYTLAPEIEKERNLKVVRIEYINDPRFLPGTKTYIGPMHVFKEVKKLDVKNHQELKKIFDFGEALISKE